MALPHTDKLTLRMLGQNTTLPRYSWLELLDELRADSTLAMRIRGLLASDNRATAAESLSNVRAAQAAARSSLASARESLGTPDESAAIRDAVAASEEADRALADATGEADRRADAAMRQFQAEAHAAVAEAEQQFLSTPETDLRADR